MLAVRRLAAGDLAAATGIVQGLPDYFTSEVAGKVAGDATGGTCLAGR